jgi:hypothetical protein
MKIFWIVACFKFKNSAKNLLEEFEDTKEVKGQKDKQRSTKHTHNPKDRVTRTPLKTGGELRFSGVMNEERTGKCLRQVEHICGHL